MGGFFVLKTLNDNYLILSSNSDTTLSKFYESEF